MAEYRVTYAIDVSADSPEEAARLADEAMRDPEAYPPILTVRDEGGVEVDVDMSEPDPEDFGGRPGARVWAEG